MTKNWDKEKLRLHDLYMAQNLKLATVRQRMIDEHGFQASERAYKQKFKEWCWFKKQQRSPSAVQIKQETLPLDSDLHEAYRSTQPLPRHHHHNHHHNPHIAHHPRADQQAPHPQYDQFSHMHAVAAFDPSYPDLTAYQGYPGAGRAVAGVASHHHQQQHGHHHQVSLPSVTHLQLTAFKNDIREAERNVETVQYEQAEQALHNAMRNLHWLKDHNA